MAACAEAGVVRLDSANQGLGRIVQTRRVFLRASPEKNLIARTGVQTQLFIKSGNDERIAIVEMLHGLNYNFAAAP